MIHACFLNTGVKGRFVEGRRGGVRIVAVVDPSARAAIDLSSVYALSHARTLYRPCVAAVLERLTHPVIPPWTMCDFYSWSINT